jgi:adenine/guanine phosphoribosyltransferase-like PRPP-binding protein
LTGQSTRLRQALRELETSKADSLKLTGLLEQSLTANERLKNYNEQIATRMQQRDEELAAAYDDIHRLEKQRLRFIIAVIVLGVAFATMVAVKILV